MDAYEIERLGTAVRKSGKYLINEHNVVLNPDKAVWYLDHKNERNVMLINVACINNLWYSATTNSTQNHYGSGPVSDSWRGYATREEAINAGIKTLAAVNQRILDNGVSWDISKPTYAWIKKTLPLVLSHYKEVNNFSSYIYTL